MSSITTKQISELIAQSEAGRVTRENLQAFLRNPNGYTSGNPTDDYGLKLSEYSVTIDYGLKISEMIDAGRYDWQNDDINERNFPVKSKGVIETKLVLVHLNKMASTAEVEAELERWGLRATTLEELLAFGASYPDEVQREFPVLALGSSWVDPAGRRYVPCLRRFGSERRLFLEWDSCHWRVHCRFLAVRK